MIADSSSRLTVGDRFDQHITVVATAMVCCSPWHKHFRDRGQLP